MECVARELSPWEEFWKEYDENGNPKFRNVGRGGGREQTLCDELKGDKSPIPVESWVEGEEKTEVDTGVPKTPFRRSKYGDGSHLVHATLVGLGGDLQQRQEEIMTPEDVAIAHEEGQILEKDLGDMEEEEKCNILRESDNLPDLTQEKREANRTKPEAQKCAGVKLIITFGLELTAVMCAIVAIYLRERMDGVVRFYFQSENGRREAVLDFVSRLQAFLREMDRNAIPSISDKVSQLLFDRARAEEGRETANVIKKIKALEISHNAKVQMIAKAQRERSGKGNGGGPAYKLGEAIFSGRWQILLRATV